jgi:hypothetical protein
MVISPLLAAPLRDPAEIPDLVGPHGYLKVYIISSNDDGPPGAGKPTRKAAPDRTTEGPTRNIAPGPDRVSDRPK